MSKYDTLIKWNALAIIVVIIVIIIFILVMAHKEEKRRSHASVYCSEINKIPVEGVNGLYCVDGQRVKK
jgi:short subunit fatty acids transporter